MIVDFQHHYTPPELMEQGTDIGALRLDENGNPNYRFNPLLADLPAHVRMMDRAGIDIAVLSCGTGFDQPDLATCRLINDRLHQAERDHPGRFIGLAHVPADRKSTRLNSSHQIISYAVFCLKKISYFDIVQRL